MGKRLPDHARKFRGKANNIPERDMFMLPYQSKWIKDTSIIRLMEKTRRCGISYGTAYDLVRQHSLKSMRSDSWVSSRDEPSAKLFLHDCKTFATALKIGAESLGERVIDEDKNSAFVLRFAGMTDINSLSSNPDAFAGKGGNVVLDEFALRKDPRMVYAIAKPSIDWGGRLSFISTHRGSDNFFNTLIREIVEKGNPKKISHHKVTLQDALDQHFLWKLQTVLPDGDPRLEMDEQDYFDYQRSSAADSESFDQEYMCIPADDAGAFLEYSLIDGCVYPRGTDWEYSLAQAHACPNPLYIGVDIGRDHDFTSMYLAEKIAGRYFTRKRVDLQAMPFSEQEAILYPWFETATRVCIDQSGIGRQFAERAAERFGKYRVEGVIFTSQSKEEMAYPVRAAFEDKAILIDYCDKFKSDLRSIKKETTSSGNIRFSADRGTNGHADRFWGVALCLRAGASKGDVMMPIRHSQKSKRGRVQNARRNRGILG